MFDCCCYLLMLLLLFLFSSYANAPDLPQFIIEDIWLHMTSMVNVLFQDVEYKSASERKMQQKKKQKRKSMLSLLVTFLNPQVVSFDFIHLSLSFSRCCKYSTLFACCCMSQAVYILVCFLWLLYFTFLIVGLHLVWFTIIFVIFCHSRYHTHAYFVQQTTNNFLLFLLIFFFFYSIFIFYFNVPQHSFINKKYWESITVTSVC